MINQKNKVKSRIGTFGASDTHYIMSNWDTATFINWWQSKMGVKDTSFKNVFVLAGTHKEHFIADWYATKFNVKIKKDRKVKLRGTRIVVNLDCETKDTNIEIKTFKVTDKEWVVPTNYWQQTQVQTYVTGKKSIILAYGLIDEDYDNFYLPIDENRIKIFPIDYDKDWVEQQYLPRERYLEWCYKHKKLPREKDFKENKYGI